MLAIWKELENCWETKTSAAIATIIATSGSTYRAAGAKSLILPDGTIRGTLSGGCVEGDIYEHAKQVISSGIPQTIRYDFRGDGDLPWGLGVGCNGALNIWLEPFAPLQQPEKALQTLEIFRKQLPSVTIIASSQPHRYAAGTKYIPGKDQADFPLPAEPGLCTVQHGDVRLELYCEVMKPIPRLFVFGAGPDAVPLVRGAKLLQWLVTVVDHRPAYANKERFPEADQIIVVPPGTYPSDLAIRETDYAVIMTHHFQQDALFLRRLLSAPLSYLGILGPQHRTERLLPEGAVLADTPLYSPIGLDIGAETPEEIAISILSEIICHVNGSAGTSLKFRKGPIHQRGAQRDVT
ncbi:XdhC family protein [Brevibacillus marinus]|uniref:XdhC family protein n=1 Tax=Brevibacillus marinus TaxID=2496837 RepID=UPI0013E07ED5|nr:XdhC/CoxI family protein [Brevibacillus marinus]